MATSSPAASPDDIPAFNRAMIELFAQMRTQFQRTA